MPQIKKVDAYIITAKTIIENPEKINNVKLKRGCNMSSRGKKKKDYNCKKETHFKELMQWYNKVINTLERLKSNKKN